MNPTDHSSNECIRCGFCLESCPTFRLTGDEVQSPRGRLYLVRLAEEGNIPTQELAATLDKCLGCRACETACPSGVPYAKTLEKARNELPVPFLRKLLLHAMAERGIMRPMLAFTSVFAKKGMGLRRIPGLWGNGAPVVAPPVPQMGLWKNDIQEPATKGTVQVLRGCSMGDIFPRVHQATERLLQRLGYKVQWLDGCCGALHAHQGLGPGAEKRLANLLRKQKDLPLLTNSAGCGAHLKDHGVEVEDISEFLLRNGLVDLLRSSEGVAKTVTYHDACHLAHGQKVRSQPRDLIRAIPGIQYVELPHADHCCGSAGVYNVLQPVIAAELGSQKVDDVLSTRAEIVALGNPGCHAWIHQLTKEVNAPVKVLHTVELLESSFSGLPAD